jgi:hypothetical protein
LRLLDRVHLRRVASPPQVMTGRVHGVVPGLAAGFIVLSISATGWAKLVAAQRSADLLTAQGIIPARMTRGIVILLSVSEIGLGLVSIARPRHGAVGAITTFSGLALYSLSVAVKGSSTAPCPCSGSSDRGRAESDPLAQATACLIFLGISTIWYRFVLEALWIRFLLFASAALPAVLACNSIRQIWQIRMS